MHAVKSSHSWWCCHDASSVGARHEWALLKSMRSHQPRHVHRPAARRARCAAQTPLKVLPLYMEGFTPPALSLITGQTW